MTLDVRERISLPGLVRVTAAPATSLAVALCRPNGSEILQVIDLKHAEVVASQDLKAMQNPQRLGLLDPTLTPDGRHLFTRSATMLHRWQVSDKGVIHRESSFPLLKEGPGLIQVTGDGRMVGLVAPQGNLRGIPDHPDPGERGTYLFVAGQIRKPPVSLSNTTGAFASDRGGRFYSLSDTGLLQVYNARGEKFGERPAFSEPVVPVRQILLHPEGSRMLILTGKTLALAVLGE
jgi:hypothetical protein